jgi:hypothetical protein
MAKNAYMQGNSMLPIHQAENDTMVLDVYDVDHVVLHVLYILYTLVLLVHHRDQLKLIQQKQIDSSTNL